MRVLLWLLLLAAAAVGLSLAARYNEGYVLFVLPPWRMEISLNLLILLQALALFAFYLLVRAVRHTLALPRSVAEFRRRRAREKADGALRDAVRLHVEGRYGHALKSAEQSYDAGHAQGLSALMALRAAHALRDDLRENHWRAQAAQHDDEIRQARLMAEAEMAIDSRRFEDALPPLGALAAASGRHIAALRLLMRAQQGLGQWDEVARLVRLLEKHRALTPEQAAPLKLRAHQEALRGRAGSGRGLLKYWESIPAAECAEPRLAIEAAKALGVAGECQAAKELLDDFLDGQWDSALVSIYGECEAGDAVGRLAQAEKWLHEHPRDSKLLLVLGRLCRRQQLWGKAQSYFEASLAVAPDSRETHIEFAQLLDELDRRDEANRHYRAAAQL